MYGGKVNIFNIFYLTVSACNSREFIMPHTANPMKKLENTSNIYNPWIITGYRREY